MGLVNCIKNVSFPVDTCYILYIYQFHENRPDTTGDESGIGNFNCTMPEEISRFITDTITKHLFTPINLARDYFWGEGVSAEKMFAVDNLMINMLFKFRNQAEK